MGQRWGSRLLVALAQKVAGSWSPRWWRECDYSVSAAAGRAVAHRRSHRRSAHRMRRSSSAVVRSRAHPLVTSAANSLATGRKVAAKWERRQERLADRCRLLLSV